MSPRALTLWLSIHLVLTLLACIAARAFVALDPRPALAATRIVTRWQDGRAIARHITTGPVRGVDSDCRSGCTQIVDRIEREGPLPSLHPWLLAISVVSGRDGIAATLDRDTAYLTPDDLLARQATSQGARLGSLELRLGLNDADALVDELATMLHTKSSMLRAHGRFRRFTVRRETPAPVWPQPMAAVTAPTLRAAIGDAARYLIRNQRADGSFVYLLDATLADAEPGQEWARHGGATLMLAQWAGRARDATAHEAALRAARLIQQHTFACGNARCVGDDNRVSAGASALALLAYVELAQSGPARTFDADIRELSAFLRALQQSDGSFVHVYDRARSHTEDIQYRYYSGEIVLALARAARVTGNAEDLRAASRGLHRLVRRSLIQNRYFFGQEHWTCQALEELWERAPDRDALAFCLDYEAFNRWAQAGDGVVEAFRGGYAPHPFAPPRVASTGSRTESALATLAVARIAGVGAREQQMLENQVTQGLLFMLRHQFRPGPTQLMRDPEQVHGGLPGSPTDFAIRIDYQQHAGGAMLRYLRLLGQ